MSDTQTIQVYCLSKALSPITHGAGSEGNEQVVMREPVMTPDGTRWVPVLSGNALRHCMIREPAARHLVEQCDLAGKLSVDQLVFLFHGGTLSLKATHYSMDRLATLYRVFPFLRLVGCSLPDQIVPGTLNVHRGVLCCRENWPRVQRHFPADWSDGVKQLPPAVTFVEPWTYYRHTPRQTVPELLPPEGETESGGGMIFSGQSVIAGAIFAHGFVLARVSRIEIGCFVHSIRRWVEGGATVGGQAARGHGRLAMSMSEIPDAGECEAEYVEHVASVQEEAVALLGDYFAVRSAKPKGGKKQKALVPDDAAEEE